MALIFVCSRKHFVRYDGQALFASVDVAAELPPPKIEEMNAGLRISPLGKNSIAGARSEKQR